MRAWFVPLVLIAAGCDEGRRPGPSTPSNTRPSCALPVCGLCACDATTACDPGCSDCDPECGTCRAADAECVMPRDSGPITDSGLGDASSEDGGSIDAGPCAFGPSRALSEPCCTSLGIDACGADLFCEAFDGRTQATCYADGSRREGQSCSADLHCAGGRCPASTRTCAPRVVINEASSEGSDNIELYNTGTTVADLAGWSVTDSNPSNAPYLFPAGVTLRGGSYLVLTRDIEHTFGLGGIDGITLRNDLGATVDTTSWPDSGAIPAWCRRPDGTGPFVTCAATFGASNGF